MNSIQPEQNLQQQKSMNSHIIHRIEFSPHNSLIPWKLFKFLGMKWPPKPYQTGPINPPPPPPTTYMPILYKSLSYLYVLCYTD